MGKKDSKDYKDNGFLTDYFVTAKVQKGCFYGFDSGVEPTDGLLNVKEVVFNSGVEQPTDGFLIVQEAAFNLQIRAVFFSKGSYEVGYFENEDAFSEKAPSLVISFKRKPDGKNKDGKNKISVRIKDIKYTSFSAGQSELDETSFLYPQKKSILSETVSYHEYDRNDENIPPPLRNILDENIDEIRLGAVIHHSNYVKFLEERRITTSVIKQTDYNYDKKGHLLSIITRSRNPEEENFTVEVTEFEYDQDGNEIRQAKYKGTKPTEYFHDENSPENKKLDVIKRGLVLEKMTIYNYDEKGFLLSTITRSRNPKKKNFTVEVMEFERGKDGNLLKKSRYKGIKPKGYFHDKNSSKNENLDVIKKGLVLEEVTIYNERGRSAAVITQTYNPEKKNFTIEVMESEYDQDGNLVKQKKYKGIKPKCFVYDKNFSEKENLDTIKNGLGLEKIAVYNERGRLAALITQTYNSEEKNFTVEMTEFEYDQDGNEIKQAKYKGIKPTGYVYDKNSPENENLDAIRSGLNLEKMSIYNERGFLRALITQSYNPEVGFTVEVTELEYDQDDNVVKQKKYKGIKPKGCVCDKNSSEKENLDIIKRGLGLDEVTIDEYNEQGAKTAEIVYKRDKYLIDRYTVLKKTFEYDENEYDRVRKVATEYSVSSCAADENAINEPLLFKVIGKERYQYNENGLIETIMKETVTKKGPVDIDYRHVTYPINVQVIQFEYDENNMPISKSSYQGNYTLRWDPLNDDVETFRGASLNEKIEKLDLELTERELYENDVEQRRMQERTLLVYKSDEDGILCTIHKGDQLETLRINGTSSDQAQYSSELMKNLKNKGIGIEVIRPKGISVAIPTTDLFQPQEKKIDQQDRSTDRSTNRVDSHN